MASYTVNWNDIIDMSFHQTKPICQFKWCLIAILLLGCSIFPESLFALPDAEVQELVRSDPIFAYAEKTLLNTWAVTPKSIKRTIRNEQMAWIKTKRDQEAAELMGQGFSFSQAYAISTAVRNNYIYMIIPSSERYKATYLNIDALIQQYNAAYTPQPKPPVYNYNTTNRANTNRHSPLDKAFTSAISWLGLCFVWFGGMVVVGLVRSLIRAADKKFFIFKGPAKPHMESKPAAANEESQKAAEQAEAAERQRQFERENAEREARERLEQEAKNRAEEEARRKAERKETLKVAPKRDPHKVLGVSASDSLEEIRKAYRELSKKYHPDRVHDPGVEFQEMADKKFKEITLAWDEIKKRRQGL